LRSPKRKANYPRSEAERDSDTHKAREMRSPKRKANYPFLIYREWKSSPFSPFSGHRLFDNGVDQLEYGYLSIADFGIESIAKRRQFSNL
jgi:hypothetical protein